MTTREELIELVQKIVGCAGTEVETDAWLDEFQRRVPHPAISDLIYHGDRALTPEEIVDLALAYCPTPLDS
jgi:hypothetical protein